MPNFPSVARSVYLYIGQNLDEGLSFFWTFGQIPYSFYIRVLIAVHIRKPLILLK